MAHSKRDKKSKASRKRKDCNGKVKVEPGTQAHPSASASASAAAAAAVAAVTTNDDVVDGGGSGAAGPPAEVSSSVDGAGAGVEPEKKRPRMSAPIKKETPSPKRVSVKKGRDKSATPKRSTPKRQSARKQRPRKATSSTSAASLEAAAPPVPKRGLPARLTDLPVRDALPVDAPDDRAKGIFGLDRVGTSETSETRDDTFAAFYAVDEFTRSLRADPSRSVQELHHSVAESLRRQEDALAAERKKLEESRPSSASAAAAASIVAGIGASAFATESPNGAKDGERFETPVERFFREDVDTEPPGLAMEEYVMFREIADKLDARDQLLFKSGVLDLTEGNSGASASAAAAAAEAAVADGTTDVVLSTTASGRQYDVLELLTKSYCADFFCEPMGEEHGERACRRGEHCVFKVMATRAPDSVTRTTAEEGGFVCKELLLPSQKAKFDATNDPSDLPTDRQLCLGCNRMRTTLFYYLYQSRGQEPRLVLQSHRNTIGEPGEYGPHVSLNMTPGVNMWTGVVAPYVKWLPMCFTYQTVTRVNGRTGRVWNLKGAVEDGVDFRLSPSTTIGGVRLTGCPPLMPMRPVTKATARGTIPAMTPRHVLGRFYDSEFDAIARLVFVPFDETRAGLTTDLRGERGIADALLAPLVVFGEDVMSFRAVTVENALAGKSCHSVLLALLVRICAAQMRIDQREVTKPAQRYWLQLFIDTHLDLATAMHRRGAYSDSDVTGIYTNDEEIARSVLETHMPHDMRVEHYGALPDIGACLDHGNIWFHVDLRPRVNNVWEAIVHLFASKTLSHKCQGRNYVRILYQYACSYSALMPLLRVVLLVSLLGNYPFCGARPRFAMRMHVLHSMRLHVLTDSQLLLWIYENEQIMFCAMKEFYRALVMHNLALDMMLRDTTNWREVSWNISDAMDMVRCSLPLCLSADADRDVAGTSASVRSAAAAAHYTATLQAVNADLRDAHDRHMLPLITKLRCKTASAMLAVELTRFFSRNILKVLLVRPQSSAREIVRIVGVARGSRILRIVRAIVRARVSRFRGEEPVELRWLRGLGMTEAGLRDLRALCFEYETRDIADNSIERRVRALYTNAPLDFFLAHVYFLAIERHRSRAAFDLPYHTAARQALALRNKLVLAPSEEMPRDADTMYYCPGCEEWLAPVIESDESLLAPIPDPSLTAGTARSDLNRRRALRRVRMSEKVHAIGQDEALFAPDHTGLRCGKQHIPKKILTDVDDGMYDKLLDVELEPERLTEARRVRNFLSTPRCDALVAIPVNMIGRCQRLRGMLWAMCEVCACITQWDSSKYGPLGFTCGFHDRHDDAVAAAAVTMVTPARGRAIAAVRAVVSEQHMRDVCLRGDVRDDARRVAVLAQSNSLRCAYCEGTLGENVSSVYLLNDVETADTAPSMKFEATLLCAQCGKSAHHAGIRSGGDKGDKYMRKSVVFEAIQRARDYRNHNTDIRSGTAARVICRR